MILPDIRMVLGCIYLPGDQPAEVCDLHFCELDSVSSAYPNFRLVLVGDYNLPGIDWSDQTSKGFSEGLSAKGKLVFEAMHLHDLHQHNRLQNHSGNVLDLLLTNADVVCRPADPLVPPDDAHPPFELNITTSSHYDNFFPNCQFTYNFIKPIMEL